MSSEFMRRMAPAWDPPNLPEHHVWTLTKNGRTAEARTRMVPIGDGRPELRIYVTRLETGELDLLWSQVLDGGRQVGELAEAKRRDFEAKGWIDVPHRGQRRAHLAMRTLAVGTPKARRRM